MPPPALLPVELVALIEQNITDESNQQNTAQRVREVLLYIVGSLGIPLDPGTPSNPDYAALMAEIAKKADKIATAALLKQKEQAFKPFAQSELATIEYAYSNLALRPLLQALIKAVSTGLGNGATATAPSLSFYKLDEATGQPLIAVSKNASRQLGNYRIIPIRATAGTGGTGGRMTGKMSKTF